MNDSPHRAMGAIWVGKASFVEVERLTTFLESRECPFSDDGSGDSLAIRLASAIIDDPLGDPPTAEAVKAFWMSQAYVGLPADDDAADFALGAYRKVIDAEAELGPIDTWNQGDDDDSD